MRVSWTMGPSAGEPTEHEAGDGEALEDHPKAHQLVAVLLVEGAALAHGGDAHQQGAEGQQRKDPHQDEKECTHSRSIAGRESRCRRPGSAGLTSNVSAGLDPAILCRM